MEERLCLECGRPFQGRADKKFCTDACRNAYNNREKMAHSNYMRKVNGVLAKNRRILEQMNPSGKTKTHRDKMIREGFDFGYFTDTYKTKNGDIYKYCYEQGYLETGDGFFLLVKKDT